MAILNYTTTVPVLRTAGEITTRLAKHGARQVTTRYDNAQPAAIGFSIDTEFGLRGFDLPANPDGVYKALTRDREVPPRYKTRQQADRVAWRILKDWVEAQLALIEAGLATLDTVMLPYMITNSGRTLAVEYRESAGLRRAINPPPAPTQEPPP